MPEITKPGIYTDMPTADYFSDPAPTPSLTQSVAKVLIERSPLHAWHAHPRLGGKVEREDYDKAKAIGNAAHKLFLGRGKEVVIIEADDFRKKEAQVTRDAVFAEGRVPILAKHHGRAVKMAKVAADTLAGMGLTLAGDSEAVLAWQEDRGWFRSMVDLLSADRRIVLDYKTSGMCCAPYRLGNMMADAGWDVQAAFHERGLNMLDPDGAGRRRHIFVAQENEEPYAVTVAELPESALTMGRKQLAYAIELWAICLRRDVWPGYPTEIVRPEYPGFKESQWLGREIEHEERREREPMLTDLSGG